MNSYSPEYRRSHYEQKNKRRRMKYEQDKQWRQKEQNRNREYHREYKTPQYVVGVDAEGVNIGGGHQRLALLAAATEDGWTDYIEDTSGNDIYDCLAFLLNLGRQHPRAVITSYSFTYDFTEMMASHKSYRSAVEWWITGKCLIGNYKVEYRPKKYLWIQDRSNPNHTVTIYDCYGYFQTSFHKAINKYLEVPQYELDFIAEMKTARAGDMYKHCNAKDIRRYCLMECRYISQLYDMVLTQCRRLDWYPKKHYGPGAIAAHVLEKKHVKQYQKTFNDDIEQKALQCYFGGNFSTYFIGHTDKTIGLYDINSAYPNGASKLPCLKHAEWKHNDNPKIEDIQPWDMVMVAWKLELPALYAPFPHRRPNDDRIMWPASGKGRYYGVEILQAIDTFPNATFILLEAEHLITHCNHQPLAWIEGIYNERLQLKRDGDPAEIVLKLFLNSAYGKFAQRNYGKHQAPFQCHLWAGMITAHTRAQLLHAIKHNTVIQVATDSVAILGSEAKGLDIGNGLGQWSHETTSKNSLFVANGTYVVEGRVRTRGFANHEFNIDAFVEAWHKYGVAAKVPIRTRRLINVAQALTRARSNIDQYHELVGKWEEKKIIKKFMPNRMLGRIPSSVLRDPRYPNTDKVDMPYPLDISGLDTLTIWVTGMLWWTDDTDEAPESRPYDVSTSSVEDRLSFLAGDTELPIEAIANIEKIDASTDTIERVRSPHTDQ